MSAQYVCICIYQYKKAFIFYKLNWKRPRGSTQWADTPQNTPVSQTNTQKLEKRLSRLPFTIFSTRSRWWRCLAPLNFFNSSILFPRVSFLLLANNAVVTDEAVVFVADSFILTFMSFLVRDCTSSSIFVAGCFTIRNASGWLVCCWCCNGYSSGRLVLPAIVENPLRVIVIVVTTAMLLVGWEWWAFCCCCLSRCFNADQRRGIAVGIINGWCLFNFPSSNWEIHTIFWLHRC